MRVGRAGGLFPCNLFLGVIVGWAVKLIEYLELDFFVVVVLRGGC